MINGREETMSRKSREYGLMAGITIGFAIWGSVLSSDLKNYGMKEEAPYVQAASPMQNETALSKTLQLHAGSAVLLDGDSGRVLYEKEGDMVRPMASTTKIMTCIVALENGNLSDICTVSQKAASQPKVHLGAPKGTQFCLKDLLYSLMLESHNDSAYVIAEHIGGSAEGFAELMNQKARDLGCEHTYFITPNGLDASVTLADGSTVSHSTTAEELAQIMRYCITESPAREQFLEITQAPSHAFSDVSGKRTYSCINHNALLTMLSGAISGKTGFTGGAGYSYVGAVQDEGRTFIIALLGCGWPPHKTYKWEDARTLLRYGAEHFHYRELYEEPKLDYLTVKNGIPGEHGAAVALTTGLSEKEKTFSYLLGEEEQVTVEIDCLPFVEAPVTCGELVGAVRYLLDGRVIRLEPVYTAENMARMDIIYRIKHFLRINFS